MNKKKTVIRTLSKHIHLGVSYDRHTYRYTSTCECLWEATASAGNVDKLHAKHVYSKIKKALKKRKQIKALCKGTNGTR